MTNGSIPTSNGYYRLVNTKSGLAMAVENASRADGAPIVQFAFSYGTGNYEWLIQHTDRGTYNFINRWERAFSRGARWEFYPRHPSRTGLLRARPNSAIHVG
jgi:hypothetical protein